MHLGKRQWHVRRLVILLLSTGPWWAGLAAAATLYVSPVGTNNAPTYPDWAGAATSLNAAVNAATNGDAVYVTNETYILTNQVNVTNGVTIQGYGGRPTISGGSSVRCFYLSHTNAVLDNLAIIRGTVNGYGAGVYIGNGGTVQNCLIAQNTANYTSAGGRGGGIYIVTTGNVFSCLIVSNNTSYNGDTTSGGGGIYMVNGLVRNCTNAYNLGSIARGGGIHMTGGRVEGCWIGPANNSGFGAGMQVSGGVVSNCVITNNDCAGWSDWWGGAGIYMSAGTVQNCILVANNIRWGSGATGPFGGGMYMTGGSLRDSTITANSTYTTYSRNGVGVTIGGGIVSNCTITKNYAPYDSQTGGPYGCGVYMYGGTVRNSRIYGNLGNPSRGGGVYMSVGTLWSCLVSNNTAFNGGGVYADGSSGVVKDCTIVNNSGTHATYPSAYSSGGVYANNATVSNCTITYNSSVAYGGGMSLLGAAMVKNCLIVANYAASYGGGLYNGSAGTFQNCTIVGNSAVTSGGGMYGGTATNCIIVSNKAANLASVTAGYSCSPDVTHGSNGNITNLPVFVSWGSGAGTSHVMGNYRLTSRSPCLNTGQNQDWVTNAVDLDGGPRLRYSIVDMGAYELLLRGALFSVR